MSELTAAALDWLAAHHGVITTAQLRSCGVGRCTIDRLVPAGVLRHVAKSVFVIASSPPTFEQRCAVLCAIHPRGFVTGPSAGMLAGLRRMPRTTSIHLAVRHGRHLPAAPGVTFRQTRALTAADHEERDGIVVASWARLAFDLAADLRPLDHQSVVNQLVHERRVTPAELAAIDRRLGHPARPGSGLFRRTLLALDGSAPSQSDPEVVLAAALHARGVPVETQLGVVRDSDGIELHLDLAVPAVRWGIELDIHPEHRSIEGHAADAGRRRALHRQAWQIETVSEHDMRDVGRLADELLGLYQHRLHAHRSVS